jgi:integrase
MAQLSSNSIQILNGKVTLTKRNHSSAWQMRYKIGTRWLRESTKEKELKEAQQVAEEIYLRAKFRQSENLPIVSKRFDAVARLARDKMKAQLANDEGKKVYKDYVRVIDNYLIDFFGSYNITSISYELLHKYAIWRDEKIGNKAKASTISTHNSALNKIFDEAMLHNYMNKAQIPQLVNKGAKGERRSDFTLSEYKYLIEFMRTWVTEAEGKRKKSVEMRELLRDYVLILANTGMRHGTESYGLKWKHVSWHLVNKEKLLVLSVDGKTKQRELIARRNCVAYFKRIHDRSEDIRHLTFDELLANGVDKYVFRLSDGTQSKSLGQTFEILMRDSGLLVDRRTDTNRSLYSLRHTYATFALLYEGIDLFTLEKQMGTSAEMIRKHYAHITARMYADKLGGKDYEKLIAERKAALAIINDASVEAKENEIDNEKDD